METKEQLLKMSDYVDLTICIDNSCFIDLYSDQEEKMELRFKDFRSVADFLELNGLEVKDVILDISGNRTIFKGEEIIDMQPRYHFPIG